MRDELLVNPEIQIASQPMLDVDYASVKEGEGFNFTLTFDTFPEVVLGEYKGVKVAALDNTVTDDEIANEKNRLLKDKIVVETKAEQVIALGDIAVFDFLGSVDGVPFDGGAAENYELEIGSHQFIPGFEEQMVGMEANTEKDITVTFPENYGAPNLAGKEAVFHITLHEVKAKTAPELTDELVVELKIEGVNTVEEFNAHVVNSLTERKTNYNTRQIENAVIETVMNAATVDLPRSFVADRVKSLKAQVEAQAKQYNIPFEMFLQFSGVNVEQFEAQCQEEANRQVKMELVLDKIAEVEGLLPTDEQIAEAIKNYSLTSKMSFNDIEKRIGKGAFAAQIASNNAIKLILDTKVVE
jgi:trigger factor